MLSFLGSLLVGVLLASGNGNAETITVDDDGPADYDTIREALEHAAEGDIIRVHEGEYREKVSVGIPVSIIGNGSGLSILRGDGSGPVIRVEADGVVISGIGVEDGSIGIMIVNNGVQVENISSTDNSNAGILVDPESEGCVINGSMFSSNAIGVRIRGTNASVHDCSMAWNDHGAYLEEGSGNRLTSNELEKNSATGILVGEKGINNTITGNRVWSNGKGINVNGKGNLIEGNECYRNSNDGIFLGSNSDSNTVARNVCYENIDGIELEIATNSMVTENIVTGNVQGIFIYQGGGHGISGNVVDSNERGVSIRNSLGNEVVENRIGNNSIGLYVFNESLNTVVRANEFDRNDLYGMQLTASHGSRITDNRFTWNFQGLFVDGNSRDSRISGNDFLENEKYGLNSFFNDEWGVEAQHNYWGDYGGPFDPEEHPNGTGDKVTIGVIYSPWSLFPNTMRSDRCRLSGMVWSLYAQSMPFTEITIEYLGIEHTIFANEYGHYISQELPCGSTNVTMTVLEEGYRFYQQSVSLGNDSEFTIDLMLAETPINIHLTGPTDEEVVSGEVVFHGSVTYPYDPVCVVQLRINEGTWVNISENSTFSYVLSLKDRSEGRLRCDLRATDGSYESEIIYRTLFITQNSERDDDPFSSLLTMTLLGLIIAASICVVWLGFHFNRVLERWYGVTRRKVKQWEVDDPGDRGVLNTMKQRIRIMKEDARERRQEEEPTSELLGNDEESMAEGAADEKGKGDVTIAMKRGLEMEGGVGINGKTKGPMVGSKSDRPGKGIEKREVEDNYESFKPPS